MTSVRTLQPEDMVAHYRVVGPLGSGGMGEVYLAQDRTLERNVALKVLPAEFVKDDERLRRFVLEAKSASSLSHPNIVTIYEIGSDVVRSKDGKCEPDSSPVQFISMELIHGRTLTTLIHEEKTDVRTLLGYLAQAAEGLAKAHGAGIIHRDLKPGNVMVSSDGFAKVLDFGLAKLSEHTDPDEEMSGAPTVLEPTTGAGSVMGTTGYMSPEQVRGKPVDQRSDIFSFGCILYEAVTRKRPFVADSAVETMHKILNEAPPPIEERHSRVPPELRRIVRRCLAKSPDQRFQSMKDLALELREVVDEWDNLTSTATSAGTLVSGRIPLELERRSRWIVPAALLVAVAAIVLAVWAVRRGAGPALSQPFESMAMSTQTNRGDVAETAISRDGRYLAYLAGEVGKTSVRVRQVATGTDLEVVPVEDGLFQGLSFSPDGNYLFYLKRRRDAPNYSGLMQVPSLGGVSRERAFDVDSRVSFSPDGKRVVFVRGEPQSSKSHLVIRELDSGSERILRTVPFPRQIIGSPDWSPDGRRIAVGELEGTQGSFAGSIVVYDAVSGEPSELETVRGSLPGSIAWLSDGRGIVRSGLDLGSSATRQIAIVPYPKGPSRRITNDTDDYASVSVSTADEAVAAVRASRLSDLWLVGTEGGDPQPVTSYRNPENSPFSVSVCPDGSILYAAARDRSIQIWSVDAAGGAPKSLTNPGSLSVRPRCYTGGFIFDRFDAEGGAHVWRADAGGGNARVLIPGAAAQANDVAKDGSFATYATVGSGEVWSIPLAGGAPRTFGEHTNFGRFSRDGSQVLISELKTGENGLLERSFRVFPAAGGPAKPGPKIPARADNINFSADGTALAFVDSSGPVWNLFRAPLDGSPVRPVTAFKEGRITAYEFSPDGRKLAVALTIGDATNVWTANADGSKPAQVTRYPAEDVFDLHWMTDGTHLLVNAGKLRRDAVLITHFR
jgi:serine/threonine protein kinase/Tol biopolymer transport system component